MTQQQRECAPSAALEENGLELDMPTTRKQLRGFLSRTLNLEVPSVRVCGHHASPMDYLWFAYSRDFPGLRDQVYRNAGIQVYKGENGSGFAAAKSTGSSATGRAAALYSPPVGMTTCGESVTSGDCVVWANRAGGKTQLAAVATLLEGLFKPGCQTRILAGSLAQSQRMYGYLCDFIERRFGEHLDGKLLKESCRFVNGANVELLSQSSRAVRGQHVQKLRCDEVELFDADVLNAAQFITQSNDRQVAAMEIFSTLHRPYGLMQELIDNAVANGTPVFQWCLWEVIERCRGRSCSRCPLNEDCRGKAKRARGYLRIDDAIAQMRRASRVGFESEMLCLRPNMENAVFGDFDESVHVKPVGYDPSLGLYRAMDFGFTNPFVCLWMQVDRDGVVRVIDEYVQNKRVIAEHAKVVLGRTPCAESGVACTFCDPSGGSANGVTGTGEVKVLREMGMRIKHQPSRILAGIEMIRAAVRAGDGSSRLVIDPKCTRLIAAMQCYHYPSGTPSELPEKDGVHDHPVDALRYFFVNMEKKLDLCPVRY